MPLPHGRMTQANRLAGGRRRGRGPNERPRGDGPDDRARRARAGLSSVPNALARSIVILTAV